MAESILRLFGDDLKSGISRCCSSKDKILPSRDGNHMGFKYFAERGQIVSISKGDEFVYHE